MKTFTITISVADFNGLTEASLRVDRMYLQLKSAEESCRRKREELRRLQAKYDELKASISGAGAPGKPHTNKTNDGPKTLSVLLANETEGRVSGGKRAGNNRVSQALAKAAGEEEK